jgi:hypothetical protein
MPIGQIEEVGHGGIYLLLLSFFAILAIFSTFLWYGWFVSKKRGSRSPYSKQVMSLGVDKAASVVRLVEGFLLNHSQPENAPFDFTKAAICEQTGRIFPNAVKRGELIQLDWSFLQKRYPGSYVSWGSLTETEQAVIRMCHESMRGFQTQSSCPRPLPKEIDSYHALLKPGPLYVDKSTKILLGWQEVPGTPFEVLIVQKPIYQSIDETL